MFNPYHFAGGMVVVVGGPVVDVVATHSSIAKFEVGAASKFEVLAEWAGSAAAPASALLPAPACRARELRQLELQNFEAAPESTATAAIRTGLLHHNDNSSRIAVKHGIHTTRRTWWRSRWSGWLPWGTGWGQGWTRWWTR